MSSVLPGSSISSVGLPPSTPPDILIGQAYFLRFDLKLWEAQQPYAPLGALYAAAAMRERGYRVVLFDAMLAESESEWAAALDEHRPAVAVLYEDSFNYLSKMCLLRMRDAALAMVDAARARGLSTVIAGSDASDHPEMYLASGAESTWSCAAKAEVTLVEALDDPQGASDTTDRQRWPACASAGVGRAHGADRDARDRPGPRPAAGSGVGSRRRRTLSRHLAPAPRVLLDEHRDDAGVSVSLQLVR